MARSENRERLPDWLESTWDAFRMNQMTQILERRLSSLEEAIIEIDLSGDSAFGNLEFAPLNHTHNEIEILDLGEGDYYVTVEYLENTFILDQISDVDLTGVQGGYVLTRNGANDGWIAAPASSGGAVFSPVITNPQLDDILIYNGSIWENAAPGDTPFVLRAGDSMEGNLNFPGELQLRFGSLTHRIGFSNSDNALLVGSTAGLDLSGTQVEVLSSTGNQTFTALVAQSTFTFTDGVESLILRPTAADFELYSATAGSNITLAGRNTADNADNLMIRMDPDAGQGLYWNGLLAAETIQVGLDVRDTNATDARVQFKDNVGTLQGYVRFTQSAGYLTNFVPGQDLLLQVENISSSQRTGIQINPDDFVRLLHPGSNTVSADTTDYGFYIRGTGAFRTSQGTGAQRPTAEAGMFRYNTDGTAFEGYLAGAINEWRTFAMTDDIPTNFVPDSRTLDVDGTANEIDASPAGPLDLTADRVWTIGLADNAVLPGVASVTIPIGTTAQEPIAANGMLRYDSTTNKLRAVENGSWVDLIGGGGNVSNTGTPVDNQIAVWTDATTIEGTAGLTFDGTDLVVGGALFDLNNSAAATATEVKLRNSEGGIMMRTDGADGFILRTDNAGVDVDDYMRFNANGSIQIYHNDTLAFETSIIGVTIFDGGGAARLTISGGITSGVPGGELVLDGAGTDTSVGLDNNVGVMEVKVGNLAEIGARFVSNGAAELWHDNTNTLETTSYGVDIVTTGAFKLPDGTTAQEPTAENGMLRYDTTTNKLRAVEGGSWVDVIGGGGGSLPSGSVGDMAYISTAPNTYSATNLISLDIAGNSVDIKGQSGSTVAMEIAPASTSNAFGVSVQEILLGAISMNMSVSNTTILSSTSSKLTLGTSAFGGVQVYDGNDGVQFTSKDAVTEHLYFQRVSAGDWQVRNDVNSGETRMVNKNSAGTQLLMMNFSADNGVDVLANAQALAFSVERTSAQRIDMWGDSGGNYIQSESDTAASKSMIIRATTDDAGTVGTVEPSIILRGRQDENMGRFVGGGAAELFFDGVRKLGTTATGAYIDNGAASALFVVTGADAEGNEGGQINIEGAGTDTYVAIDNFNGDMRLLLNNGSEVGIDLNVNAEVGLYHNNTLTTRTATLANGGLEVDKNYNGGLQPVLTTGDVQGAVKAVTTSRTSTTTLADDSELAGFELEPSSSYIIEVVARFDGNGATNNGFRWGFDYNGQVANVTVADGGAFSYQTGGASESLVTPTNAVSQVKNTFDAAGVDEVVEIKIGITTNGSYTSGTAVDFQFAQAVSQATATRLGAGSYMRVTKIA